MTLHSSASAHNGASNQVVMDKRKDGEGHMSLARKLMMCASLFGMEAADSFEYLYTMPVLQTLGMPLNFVSFTGLVAGPFGMLVLPLMGWLSDRGSNPVHRKAVALVVANGLLAFGMACVLTANLINLSDLLDANARYQPESNSSSAWNMTLIDDFALLNSSGENVSWTTVSGTEESTTPVYIPSETYFGVPFKAILGLLGFASLDVGMDSVNAVSRSYLLVCSPRGQHTSLLILALVVASAGGLLSAALGIVDVTALLGLEDFEGASITIQTTFQVLVAMLSVLIGVPITLAAARRQLRDNRDNQDAADTPDTYTEIVHDPDPRQQVESSLTNRYIKAAFESSIRSMGRGVLSFDQSTASLMHEPLLLSSERTPLLSRRDKPNVERSTSLMHESSSEQTALLSRRENSELTESQTTSLSVSYGDVHHPARISSEPSAVARHTAEEEIPEEEMLETLRQADRNQSGCCAGGGDRGVKTKVVFVSMSTFFSTGVLMMFTYTSSDYVGKAIFGGDPDAAPGSESLARYQGGLRASSWGFLVYYGSYLCVCLLHPRILALLGKRLEFVLVHLLMTVAMTTVSLTARLEAFYFMAVVAGFHRACLFVIPFAVTNDVMQSMGSAGGDNVGLAMSLLTASLPLSYLTLFPWVGTLEAVTGLVAMPLFLGAGYGCLASISFLLIGKV